MKRKTRCLLHLTIFLILLLVLFLPGILTAAPEQRTALVIGNSSYNTGSLRNPVNDADDMASAFKRLGFDVILKKNTSQQDMEDAIRDFGNSLKRGGVGLFFYAGHGVQISGKNFLLPIGVKIDKETDVKYRAVDADMVLDEMGNAGNPMNIVILDACRDNPFGKSFRTASRGLAIISSAPRGTLISYSTNPGNVAADGSGRNSPYTGSLMKHMMTPGLPIEEVFKNVRQDIGRATGGKQIPWELSSLEGKFYFNDRSGGGGDLVIESKRLDDERQKVAQERELLEKQRALDEEREKLEALKREQAKPPPPAVQKKEVAIVTPPTVTGPKETIRDGRFIAYDNGTVMDTRTNLMWAAKDNGNNINWPNAKSYCENYRGGGYSDWRMPKLDELAELYDADKTYKSDCGYDAHLTELIRLTCSWPWASETRGSVAADFDFITGVLNWHSQSNEYSSRVLPVRSANNEALERERQELARDKQEMERQKALDAEREQLAVERRKIEAEKLQLAMGPRPTVTGPKEIKRDGRFIAYDDGTVLDTKTNLMWAAKDNGSNINWMNAKYDCENYRGGGYTDWRMPKLDELASLYDASKSHPVECYRSYNIHAATELIDITCFISWAIDENVSSVFGYGSQFNFSTAARFIKLKSDSLYSRALPVRSGK